MEWKTCNIQITKTKKLRQNTKVIHKKCTMNSLLEFEINFIGLKHGELKDRELKIKKRNRRTIF